MTYTEDENGYNRGIFKKGSLAGSSCWIIALNFIIGGLIGGVVAIVQQVFYDIRSDISRKPILIKM